MNSLLTRRDCLTTLGAASLTLAACAAAPNRAALAQAAAIPALRKVAGERGILFGSVSEIGLDRAPPQYVDLFLEQCALFAMTVGWKWMSSHPGELRPNPNAGSIDVALRHGLKLTGAHFLWYQSAPGWFSDILDRKEGERIITDYITREATFYKDKVYSWNVVNETIEPREGRPDHLRAGSPFVRLFGFDYIPMAFRVARAADPQAILAYNDYSLELDTPEQEVRRATLLQLVDTLLRQGVPIDAIGLQSHLRAVDFADSGRFNDRKYRAFLHEIASRNLKILITELDVLDVGVKADFAERDRVVADVYSRFLPVALDERAVKAVVTWGLSDKYTWLVPQSLPMFARADGLPTRPLPFDDVFKPKPAFWAMVKAFHAAPAR